MKEWNNYLSLIIFILTFSTLFISLVSVVFPVLIPSFFQKPQIEIETFEIGVLGIPFLIANLSILILGLLYYRQKPSGFLSRWIGFLKNFEISKKVTLSAIVFILSIYILASFGELTEYEGNTVGDFENIQRVIELWPSPAPGLDSLYVLHVKNFFLKSSEILFFNIKIIPFLSSIAVLLLTYFVAKEIANKRLAGLIAFIVLIQSSVFLRFDTLATYSNFWILFYLLSLFFISRVWFLSPISYISSILSKPFSLSFLPMIIFSTLNSRIGKKRKIILSSFYSFFFLVILLVFLSMPDLGLLVGIRPDGQNLQFNFENFILGFTKISHLLRYEWFFFLFSLPVTVGLYLLAKGGKVQANSIQVQIFGILVLGFLLEGFFRLISIEVYRLIPVIVFFAIGTGILFSRASVTPQVDKG